MFFISLPIDVKPGDTADCRINGEPARVTYRDARYLVIEPGDVREIVSVQQNGDLNHFVCGHVDNKAQDYVIDRFPDGSTIVSEKLP